MHLEVRNGPFAGVEWHLASVVGEEALSELFTFHLRVTTASPLVTNGTRLEIEDALVGRDVSIKMTEEDITRYGIITSVELDQRDGAKVGALRLVMRPRAYLLTLRKNTRIFQGLYMFDIVSRVLTESGVPHRFLLGNTYLRRTYCTQYEETDYAFVTRLLAEEGVFFYFENVETFTPDPPTPPHHKNAWEKAVPIIGAAGALLSGVAQQTESNAKASGALGMLGSAASIVADLGTSQVDPEPDDPKQGASGKGGPDTNGPIEVFVFCDQTTGYRYGSALLRYDHHAGPSSPDAVMALHSSRLAGSKGIEIRDYNFRRPMALLSKKQSVQEAAGLIAPLDHYDHHGEYEKPDISDEQAQVRLEQLRASTSTMEGRSSYAAMQPGFGSNLSMAPLPFADGPYVAVKVFHEAYDADLGGDQRAAMGLDAEATALRVADAMGTVLRDLEGERRRFGEGELRALARKALSEAEPSVRAYQNRFEWVWADVPFRPPTPERVRAAVNETAVVVGPAGQAIYVDNYGRVKVQFHWDREGAYNEDSSCWIRVLSTWAGAGYGFQFVPRVGMEVIVTFLGGDPDRPVVSGSLYNATHPTPEPLPQRLTRSGFRSQTVPGGGGFNELSFEDGQGVERVFIHAQKDLHEIVNDQRASTIRGDEKTTIGGDQLVGITGARVVSAGGSAVDLVGQSSATRVGGNRIAHVSQNQAEVVRGNALSEVSGVALAETKQHDLKVVQGDCNLTVHGHHVIQVVSKQDGPKSTMTTYVDGHVFQTATGKVVLRAENADKTTDGSKLRLECGDSYIEIGGDTITLSAKNVVINASESHKVEGKKVELSGSDQIRMKRATGNVELTDSGFAVKGVDKASMGTSQSKLIARRRRRRDVGELRDHQELVDQLERRKRVGRQEIRLRHQERPVEHAASQSRLLPPAWQQ